jgi:hypothetical protein
VRAEEFGGELGTPPSPKVDVLWEDRREAEITEKNALG